MPSPVQSGLRAPRLLPYPQINQFWQKFCPYLTSVIECGLFERELLVIVGRAAAVVHGDGLGPQTARGAAGAASLLSNLQVPRREGPPQVHGRVVWEPGAVLQGLGSS